MSGEPQPTTASAGRPLFLAIAGNIGVGKSTLTRHLADKWGLTLLPEPVKQNPFLKLYYDDPKRWGMQSQLFFLTQRVTLFKEAGALNHAKIVDRTLYEDAEIFARTALLPRRIPDLSATVRVPVGEPPGTRPRCLSPCIHKNTLTTHTVAGAFI